MPSGTAKYNVPYAQQSDPVAQLPTTMQALAARLDLLLGESGQLVQAVTAGVVKSDAIVLSRTYPGNSGAAAPAAPGFVALTPVTNVGAGATVFYYVNAWTGTATTITGFTINCMSSTTTNRTVLWRFIPAL